MNRSTRTPAHAAAALAAATLMLSATPAAAIVTSSGALPSLPSGLNLGGVGLLSNGCSSVLLAGGQWLLASGHCAPGAGATVVFGGTTVATVAETFFAPGYTGEIYNDLSLSRLAAPVAGVAGYGVAALTPAFPAAVVLAGFGQGGSGATGASAASGVLRHGVNEYDMLLPDEPGAAYFGRIVGYDLDSGLAADNRFGSLGLGAGEASVASGDSGGPSFAFVGGQWQVVGIHVAVDDTYGYGHGGIGYDVLTAPYAGWIAQVSGVPEPGGMALWLAGLGVLGVALRRAPLPSAAPPGC